MSLRRGDLCRVIADDAQRYRRDATKQILNNGVLFHTPKGTIVEILEVFTNAYEAFGWLPKHGIYCMFTCNLLEKISK